MNRRNSILEAARVLATRYGQDVATGYQMLVDWSRISRYPVADVAAMVLRDAQQPAQLPAS